MPQHAHVPVSYNFINKGKAADILRAVDSVYKALYNKGDECVIVDTGSSSKDLKELTEGAKEFPNCKIVSRPELSVDYRDHVDESVLEEFREVTGSFFGLLDFAGARNVALEESSNDVIFWMDSDDLLKEENPGNLREVINGIFADGEKKFETLFMDYDYAFGTDGVLITRLRRERIFRKSRMTWKGRCHETACVKDPEDMRSQAFFGDVKSKIVHVGGKPHQISDIRNYIILKNEILETEGEPDPRTIFYMGNAARGLTRFREAIKYYKYFDRFSGSPDDRFASHYYTASIYGDPRMSRPLDALDSYKICIEIKPDDPRGYYGVARCYAILRRWKECLRWYQIGNSIPMPENQVFSFDPTHITYFPHVIAAQAARELDQVSMAMEYANHASTRPDLEESQEFLKNMHIWAKGSYLRDSLLGVLQFLPIGGPNAKRVARNFLAEIAETPPVLEKKGLGKLEPFEGRSKKPEIAFFCGHTHEPWAAATREVGIGGSEKMVIILAEALQRTGAVNASVYANVPFPMRGVQENGVNWRHWSEFDETRPRDVLVIWRCPRGTHFVQSPAKQRVLWLHDVPNPADYTDEVRATADFVQVQSSFQANPLMVKNCVPREKLWYARNAIEPAKVFQNVPPRNPKQVFYCSSPDRGLHTTARIIKRAREKDPEITLVVAYGFTPTCRDVYGSRNHGHIIDVGHDMSFDVYEREVFAALDEVDATLVHRVNFDKMQVLFSTSGIWLYPTRFPEISCMSAMEAQQHGCRVASTRSGALLETLLPEALARGALLPDIGPDEELSEEMIEICADAVVALANAPDDPDAREKQCKAAYAAFNVDDLAQQWLKKLGLNAEVSAAPSSAQGSSTRSAEPILIGGTVVKGPDAEAHTKRTKKQKGKKAPAQTPL